MSVRTIMQFGVVAVGLMAFAEPSVKIMPFASFVPVAGDSSGGVQLWENGPYWAECNVGATRPEEYGYYFWWGDTVGYKCSGGSLSGETYFGVTWVSSKGATMSSSPFSGSTCPTFDKTKAKLQSLGCIDSTGNLVPKFDAATAHLGAPWRMPTDEEIAALVSNCTTTWTNNWKGTGVNGRLVTGKGSFSTKSIFLPAAGYGIDTELRRAGSLGRYWSSTQGSDFPCHAWNLCFGKGKLHRYDFDRCNGRSVRPVRGFAK